MWLLDHISGHIEPISCAGLYFCTFFFNVHLLWTSGPWPQGWVGWVSLEGWSVRYGLIWKAERADRRRGWDSIMVSFCVCSTLEYESKRELTVQHGLIKDTVEKVSWSWFCSIQLWNNYMYSFLSPLSHSEAMINRCFFFFSSFFKSVFLKWNKSKQQHCTLCLDSWHRSVQLSSLDTPTLIWGTHFST